MDEPRGELDRPAPAAERPGDPPHEPHYAREYQAREYQARVAFRPPTFLERLLMGALVLGLVAVTLLVVVPLVFVALLFFLISAFVRGAWIMLTASLTSGADNASGRSRRNVRVRVRPPGGMPR